MKRLLVASLFALILSIGLFPPQTGASAFESGPGMMPKASIATVGKIGHVATGDSNWFFEWLKYKLRNFFSQVRDYHDGPKGSVPIPGTLLLFGVGFAGLVAWRSRQPRA